MKRAVAGLAAAYAVHLLGFVAFYLTWNAAFGVAGRSIPADWDIPLAYTELIATGLVAGLLTTWSVRQRVSLLLAGPQVVSMFMCCVWLWSVLLFEGVV